MDIPTQSIDHNTLLTNTSSSSSPIQSLVYKINKLWLKPSAQAHVHTALVLRGYTVSVVTFCCATLPLLSTPENEKVEPCNFFEIRNKSRPINKRNYAYTLSAYEQPLQGKSWQLQLLVGLSLPYVSWFLSVKCGLSLHTYNLKCFPWCTRPDAQGQSNKWWWTSRIRPTMRGL